MPANVPDPGSLYQLLVEQVDDYAIFALDTSGHVLSWNPGAQRLKGYTAEEVLGRSFADFYPPEDAAAGLPDQLLERATLAGRAEHEGWRVRKDGTRFWALVTITALHDAEGRLTAFAKITRDLTARRESEENARRLAAEAAAHRTALEKARELEQLNARLDEQRREVEAQSEEAQSLAEELEQSTESLQNALIEAEEARETTARAETFVRSILESVADPFVVYDAEWRFQYANPAAARLLDPSPEPDRSRFIGRVIWELYPDFVGTEFEASMRRAANERIVVTFTAFHDRTRTWSSVQAYPLPDGGLAVQWRDITAVQRADEATRYLVRASEILGSSLIYRETLNELARLVVPELADWCGVEIVGDDGILEQVAVGHVDPEKTRWGRELNRRYPPKPNAPTGPYQVLRTGKPELYPEITDEMLVAGAIDDEHLAISRSLGIQSAILVPLTARGRPLGVLTLIASDSGRRYDEQDLSLAMELAHRAAIAVENARLHDAEMKARQEAERLRVVAETANRAKTEFLATMSHELRTPLNAISGYTDLLQMGLKGPLSAGQLDYLERIARSGRYLLSLIQDVLSFAKLETGHVPITLTNVMVRPIFEEMAALMSPQVETAGLRLDDIVCDAEVQARGDVERVRQILLNLISNAVKFTPSGGRLSLRCEADEQTVRMIVEDTGRGIPADKIEEIFKPFVQLQREAAGPQAGTGLGLAISRDLAHAMDGELIVESRENVGSRFTLVLPRA